MAQHDYNIANQGAAAFRADLNNMGGAIQTVNSGATAPTDTAPAMLWYDSDNGLLKQRNAADSGWLTIKAIDAANLISNPATTKGDLLVYNGTSIVRVGVGTDGQQLVADSGQASGLNWSSSATFDYIILEDQKANGTQGGTYASGAWRTRDLNTEVLDSGGHTSITSNQFRLAVGTYNFTIVMPWLGTAASATGQFFNAARLYNTDTTTAYGKLQWQNDEVSGGKTSGQVVMIGQIVVATAADDWEVQMYPGFSYADNGGVDDNISAGVEIYTRVFLTKVA